MATRAFVFTDIEGSTKLWSDHPGLMREALAQHDDLIVAAVVQTSGEVFKHTGDGICAVFPSAPDAVSAAAAAQRSLTLADWGAIGRLRVRIAVHAGDAEPRGDDWAGPALNRTARLMGLAHGGQVLVSSSAYELASDALDHDIFVADLGTHALRGLARAEHVWQLIGEGLERSFPPLRSLDGVRGRLPSHLTSFVGRSDELDLIGEEIQSARLVTLVGPGGVGKSRLATEAGAAVIDKFPDGVWMFELAALGAADGLDALLMATLGLSGGSGSSPREALLGVVRTWRALFIVDNCEHVRKGAAELIQAMLAAGPDLVVLTTSRERLRVPGEHVVVIDPLPVESAAVQLFADRAGPIRRSTLADLDIEAVVRVCRRLDGMPLAIELAAARTVAMTPAEIERRLDRRFRLLSPTEDATGRHSSLQRTLDWSYDLLSPNCRSFFARLCVFAGAFDAVAAHRVAWPDDEFAALDMLEELVAKSLLSAAARRDRTSYRMLETMRQYGLERLPPTEAEALHARHIEHFADLAERAWEGGRGRDSQLWLDLLDDQLDDIRAAVERAVAGKDTDPTMQIAAGLFMYNHTRRLQEIYDWVDQALALPGAGQHRLASHARLHRAYGNTMRGQAAAAEGEIRVVLDAQPPGADPLKPLALFLLSSAIASQGRIDEAVPPAQAALALALQLGPAYDYDRAEDLWTLCSYALVYGSPDHAQALRYLALARELGNVRAIAGGLIQSGVSDPEPGQGALTLAEARELTARTRDSYRHGLATVFLGGLLAETDPVGALRVIPEVLQQARRAGQGLLILQMPRSYFGAFSALGGHETIAILHGASLQVSSRPVATDRAISAARQALGDERYDELKRHGVGMSVEDLEAFLMRSVGNLV